MFILRATGSYVVASAGGELGTAVSSGMVPVPIGWRVQLGGAGRLQTWQDSEGLALGAQLRCFLLKEASCQGLNSYEVLAPSTSESDCIWRQGLYRGDQVQMRSLGWPPFNLTRVFIGGGH